MNSIRQFANSHADVIAVAVLIAVLLLPMKLSNSIQEVSAMACGEELGFHAPICPEMSPFAMTGSDDAKMMVRPLPFHIE